MSFAFIKDTEYDHWKAQLAHFENTVNPRPAIVAEQPMPGRYRVRARKGGPRLALAIWMRWSDEGEPLGLMCTKLDGAKRDESGKLVRMPVAPGDIARAWTWCADHPVSGPEFKHYAEHGHWPDEADVANGGVTANGSNLPDDPFECMTAERDGLLERAQSFFNETGTKLVNKEQCDRATNLADALRKINKEADGLFATEKAPFLKGGRAVDAKFAFRKQIEETVKKLSKLGEAWMIAEERRLDAERRAKIKEERKRLEEERQKLASQDVALAELDRATPELPLEPAPVKVNAGGAYGAKSGLKSIWRARIIDYPATLQHFANHPQVKDLVASLANGLMRTSKGTVAIPGVEAVEERKATK